MASHRDPADRRFRHFCATGDPDALGDVFDRTAGRLMRVAIWLAGNRTDAEDLLQRTFLKAIETRARFRPGEPVLPWLMGLLGNEARRHRRERERAAAARPAPDRVVDPEATVVARELAATVRSVGDRLGAPYGEVLSLHLEAGFNCKEIAARLERPSGTVRTQLARALDQLRRRLPDGFAAGATGFATVDLRALDGVRTSVVDAARDSMPISAGAAAYAARPLGGILMTRPTLLALPALAVLGGTAAFLAMRPAAAPPSPPTPVIAANDQPSPRGARADGQEPERVDASAARPPAAVALPRLSRLGPMPDGDADALLQVDRRTPWREVTKLLDGLREQGADTARLAAELPTGQPGCFTLALPANDAAAPAIELRLHRQRTGVPPASVVPVLSRIVRGRQEYLQKELDGTDERSRQELAERFPEPFTVRVAAPGDAPFEEVLRVVAAASEAGVQSVLLASDGEAGGEAPAGADDDGQLAIDLGPYPRIAIAARSLPPRPVAVTDDVVGCAVPPATAAPKRERLGAGGRYGSRGRTVPRNANDWTPTDGIRAGIAWLATAQQADGSFLDEHGRADLEATALAMLALLGNDTSLYDGEGSETLSKGIGWILDQQRDDGALGAGAPGSLRHHALATQALAEAYGFCYCLELRGGLVDAVAWLRAQRNDDGGFGDGLAGAPSDAVSTAAAALALSTVEFFAIEPAGPSEATLQWFDGRAVADDPGAAATELFARFFGKRNPKKDAALTAAASRLLSTADPADPWCLCWTSYCQYQMGGELWKSWQGHLPEVTARQVADGPLAGSWAPAFARSRAATTALCVLSLQTYFRYTRMFR